ncbi:hypothetical protein CTI14_61020, partial [Methylobacterium radiotolerans]
MTFDRQVSVVGAPNRRGRHRSQAQIAVTGDEEQIGVSVSCEVGDIESRGVSCAQPREEQRDRPAPRDVRQAG